MFSGMEGIGLMWLQKGVFCWLNWMHPHIPEYLNQALPGFTPLS